MPDATRLAEIAARVDKATQAPAAFVFNTEKDIKWLLRRLALAEELAGALQLIQGFNWSLDESEHGREIKRRALAALRRWEEESGG